jgi:hypothetical protein
MNRLPEQNSCRLLQAFEASCRVGETDPPARVFRLNLYQMAGNHATMSHFLAAL